MIVVIYLRQPCTRESYRLGSEASSLLPVRPAHHSQISFISCYLSDDRMKYQLVLFLFLGSLVQAAPRVKVNQDSLQVRDIQDNSESNAGSDFPEVEKRRSGPSQKGRGH